MLFTSKGQAFETFKILIAAIIAIAILGVLMPIILNLNVGSKAEDEIKALLQEAFDAGGGKAKEITFNSQLLLPKEALADKLGYDSSHLCMGVTNVGPKLHITNAGLTYDGGGANQKVKIVIVCSSSSYSPALNLLGGANCTSPCTTLPCCGISAKTA